MKDKANRRMFARKAQRRSSKGIINAGRTGWKFLQSHRSHVLTGVLLVAVVALLFGLASQINFPTTDESPDGMQTIDYTALIEQAKYNNVQAVAIQGSDVYTLLKRPLTQNSQANNINKQQSSAANDAAEYDAWSQSLGIQQGSASSTLGPPLGDNRSFYTRVPVDGQSLLLSTLHAGNIEIDIVPAKQTPSWLLFVLRVLPMIAVVILLMVFFLRRRNQNPLSSMNNRFSQFGKSSARRADRPNSVSANSSRNAMRERVTRPSKPAHQQHPAGSFVQSVNARIQRIPEVTFADVAGVDEVRQELVEMVQFLREPEKFQRLGAHIPRGALLVGSPGTGKTLLAKAVAGEAKVPFFSMSASEFVEMYVGVGASRVRDLFQQARLVAPCVVFIDEIDAVGRKRTMRAHGSDERDQTLNQLLVELDGFDARQAVVVLAATNRVDILDKALLRPGRFDRRITVSPPDRVGREAILRVHTRSMPLHVDADLERMARLTTGMTGADLANLANEAALAAARLDQEFIDHACFEEALERAQLGVLRPIVMSEDERRIIAFHEGGHALVAHHLPEADRVNRVTILPRGQSLGVTQFSSEVDRYNYSRETLMARIAVGVGGRVAEELTFGPDRVTTGAENDLQVITDLARKMVTRWGMSEKVGVVFADNQGEGQSALSMRSARYSRLHSPLARTLRMDEQGNLLSNGDDPVLEQPVENTLIAEQSWVNGMPMNALIDAEVQRILNEGRAMARALLTEHADQLQLLAAALMEHELLDRKQFESLLMQA
jgi:ATP-dependent metalloprotease FtsH